MSSDPDLERTSVKTYVPSYQKEQWSAHAVELSMTQSEFVRTMVQAGRRGFSIEAEDPDSSDADPRGEGLEDRVRAVLSAAGPLDWDELVAEVSDDFEERLADALDELQAEGAVRHSGREGGYVLTDE